jgi:3-phytase
MSALRVSCRHRLGLVLLSACVACHRTPDGPPEASEPQPVVQVQPSGGTVAVPNDPDDPAIWIHPSDPSKSVILGTDKVEKTGGLYVFGIDGRLRQAFREIDRPNNVDVEYGLHLPAGPTDVAVLTERMRHRLRVFAIAATGELADLAPAGLPVLVGEPGEGGEPMGIALYRRPRDGAVFAIVAPKTGGAENYLWQYRVDADAAGAPRATLVRRFGRFSGSGREAGDTGEIEAVVVDDALGFVYYSDEGYGIRKYHADPDHPEASQELAAFGTAGFLGDREGLAIMSTGATTGFIVASDQMPGGTRVKLYPREGTARDPHAHPELRTVTTVSDGTDGLDVTPHALPGFPRGLLVMMTEGTRNFLLYDWNAIMAPQK